MAIEKTSPELEQKLRDAAAVGDCATIRKLAYAGVDTEARDERGQSAFHIATRYRQSDAALTLLAARQARRMRNMGIEPDTSFSRQQAAENRQERNTRSA